LKSPIKEMWVMSILVLWAWSCHCLGAERTEKGRKNPIFHTNDSCFISFCCIGKQYAQVYQRRLSYKAFYQHTCFTLFNQLQWHWLDNVLSLVWAISHRGRPRRKQGNLLIASYERALLRIRVPCWRWWHPAVDHWTCFIWYPRLLWKLGWVSLINCAIQRKPCSRNSRQDEI
jgi:hypothetical protein